MTDLEGRGLTTEQADHVRHHLWLAEEKARKMAWLARFTADGELSGYAYEALIEAARRFDPAEGALFRTFAAVVIVRAILKAARRAPADFVRVCLLMLDACDAAEGDEPGAGEPGDTDPLDAVACTAWIGALTLKAARRDRPLSPPEEHVREELDRLDDESRDLFVSYAEGVAFEELARQRGASIRTMKRRIARLRRLLIARLQARGVVEPLGTPRAEGLARGQEQLPP